MQFERNPRDLHQFQQHFLAITPISRQCLLLAAYFQKDRSRFFRQSERGLQAIERPSFPSRGIMADLIRRGRPAEEVMKVTGWRHSVRRWLYGIKSILTFPLSVGGESLIGALSFATMREERAWSEPFVKQLQLLAQVFANALARKRADLELREREARLTLTTDAAGAGLWIMELGTGEIWVSAKTRELFHFAPDEKLTYESYFKVIHPDDHERVHQDVQQTLQSGENLKADCRIVLPEGSVRWIAARGQPYPSPKPIG